jgi:lipopolysaccharide/colanic/teichoic acid biosynthesis glycosyltransferase
MAMLKPVDLDAAGTPTRSQRLARISAQPYARSQPLPRLHGPTLRRGAGSTLPSAFSQPLPRPHSQPLPRPRSQPLPRPHSQPLARPIRRPIRRPYAEVVSQIELQTLPLVPRIAKRALDVVGSTLGLIALSPLLAVIALAVVLTSHGPALFVQERCGAGGRRFRFFKFRTMIKDAEARKHSLAHLNEMSGPMFKIRSDPRITRLGSWLRKLSLDELPQLWNVLCGDMSLVGPRPPTPDEVERYSDRHVQRLSVMSGITGLWQVSGRSEIADFERWVELDLQYARSCSMWTDLRILLKTVVVVARVRGAH